MTGMLSRRSKNVSGGASSINRKKMGGRFGEKTNIMMKKEMEKKIQKAIDKAGRDLTDDQSLAVAKLIR